jgi:hypothetical protein
MENRGCRRGWLVGGEDDFWLSAVRLLAESGKLFEPLVNLLAIVASKRMEDVMNVGMSKTQKRVVKMLNLEAGDTYESAKRALEAAGYRGDATPVRKTWRDAAKMSDADLLAAIRESDEYRWNQVYPERPDRNPVRKLRQPGRRLTKAQWEKQARMGRRGPRTGPRPVKRRKKAKQVLHGLVQLPGRKNPLPVLLTTIGSGIEGGAAGAAGVTLYDELAKKKRAKAMRTRKAKSNCCGTPNPSKRRKANNPSRRRASKVTHAVAVRNKIVGMGTGAQMKKLQSGLRRAGLKAKLGVREK